GAAASTAYVSPSQLTASVSSTLLTTAGRAAVTVRNPGGSESKAVNFTISAAAPVLTSLTPASAVAGGPAFTLTVVGSGFVPDAVVQWNRQSLATTFLAADRLSAAVPAALIAQSGAIAVSVVTSGGISNPLGFLVNAPGPTI